jgi:nucleotide-binding universal stress UspA family protein
MKILLAIDGSDGSRAALEAIVRPWPPKTEIRVVSVAHTYVPIVTGPAFTLAAVRHELLERDRERASRDVDEAAKFIRASASRLNVTSTALEGVPKEVILDEAERWGADLIVLGSHGDGTVKRFLLGSVTQAVVFHAACSVEVARRRQTAQAI